MRFYLKLVSELAPAGYDPRHLLAYIYVGHSTLGHLSRDCFKREIAIAVGCVNRVGAVQAEACAKSWGL